MVYPGIAQMAESDELELEPLKVNDSTTVGIEVEPMAQLQSEGERDEDNKAALVLVLDSSIDKSDVEKLQTALLEINREDRAKEDNTKGISSFTKNFGKHIFVCLYLSEKACEVLAEEMAFTVKLRAKSQKEDVSSSSLSFQSIWAKLSSLYHYGSMSYNNFTEWNYWIAFDQRLKEKVKRKNANYRDCLQSIRAQSELIYDKLRSENMLESIKIDKEQDSKETTQDDDEGREIAIQGNFVPHECGKIDKFRSKISWLPPFFPLEDFRDYFGEELAFVYAWSNHWWTFGLIPITVMAVITLIYGLETYEELDEDEMPADIDETHWERLYRTEVNTITNYYLGFMMIWVAVFQFKWENLAAPSLSIQWGVANFRKEEPTCTPMKKYEKLQKIPNLIISLIGIILAGSLTIVLFMVVEIFLRRELRKNNQVDTRYTNLICPVVYGLLNLFLGSMVIPALAKFLTDLECHKFRSIYINSIIFKYTGYYLVSSYFYLIFLVLDLHTYLYKRYQVDSESPASEDTVVKQEAIEITQVLLIQVVLLRLKGVAMSFLGRCWSLVQRWRARKRQESTPISCDLENILKNYNSSELLDTSVCNMWMSERVIMYGYLVMFSYHVPITAIIALVLEALVTRYEMEMLVRCQRPHPRRVGNIKQWEGIIYLINIVSIIVNAFSLSMRALRNPDDCVLDYGDEGCDIRDDQLALLFMPVFIVIASLIEIQDAVSGDFVQGHLQKQYKECVDLVRSLIPND